MSKWLIALVLLSGCVEEPPSSLGGAPNLSLDEVDTDMALDSAEPDASSDTGADTGCVPELSEEFCQRLGKDCGSVSAIDNCNAVRGTDCGDCPEGEACGGGELANVCAQGACLPETDEDFCLASSRGCGTFTGVDQCDTMRTANCGTCSSNRECIEGHCECIPMPQSDLEFCAQRYKDCGQLTGKDSCGETRTADCSTCLGEESCGVGNPGTPNVCGLANICVPESTEEFCQTRGKDCGIVQGMDNCRRPRMEDCGTCTLPENCGAAGNQNVCGCVPTTCQTGACGAVPNGCGEMMNCGCNVDEVCAESICCQPETVCEPGQCGLVSDGCGGNKDCGMCAEGTCIAGSCQCVPEDDAAFCARNGTECGDVANIDNCGMQRLASCGPCPNNNWTCVNHQCVNPGGN